MSSKTYREIPYNYTSADDRKIIEILFSSEMWAVLEKLRKERKTGRTARLLLRIIGELFIYFRNPYLRHHLTDSLKMKRNFFTEINHDFEIIKMQSEENQDVHSIVKEVEKKINELRADIKETVHRQETVRKEFSPICGKENIFFDPFTVISHSTDATDWRLHLPFAVLRPSSAGEIPQLLKTAEKTGFKVIVCGGLTGLTGGAVPLVRNCIVINMEKLNRIYPVTERELTVNGNSLSCKAVKVEAGVITEDAIKAMSAQGYVFATDPTSSWASTIGGNIAENAGGKYAVKWGTAIDNILSFEFASPQGELLLVERVNHQNRKILHNDIVSFSVTNKDTGDFREIHLRGYEIRKPGLWKDITNKVLGGIPGLQKEGTDGIILSADFILYPKFSFERTFCLEFFGENFDEAGQVINEISESFPLEGKAALTALEHFDREYVKAVSYRVKSGINRTPKAVLLIDMASFDENEIILGEKKLKDTVKKCTNTEIHTAKNSTEAALFWNDRKHLGAIAKRTNAFKLNEDIVLPLKSLSLFSDWTDEINVREEKYIQLKALNQLEEYLKNPENETDFYDKLNLLIELTDSTEKKIISADKYQILNRVFFTEFQNEMKTVLRGYDALTERISSLCTGILNTVLIIANHMHAGDGNVHVNIPVLSNDLDMMRRAEHLVDEVMAKTLELGGAVSGEHGIGITKIKYLDDSAVLKMKNYLQKADPSGLMNPEKLVSKSVINKVFTPSFNLLELEARILKYGNLETLAGKIAHCVRCGKCKTDCCVFHPAQNMFFHPRNKNLAIGSLIEAVLFEVQRYRNVSFELLGRLEEIADNCTVCHKCKIPCPVKIDTGEITVLERNLLVQRGIKKTPSIANLTLKYLSSTSPVYNRLIHTAVLGFGVRLQNVSSRAVSPLQSFRKISNNYTMMILQVPSVKSSFKVLHDFLPRCESNQILMFEGDSHPESTYFYFPGCGSERLFSEISLAGLYLLLKSKARVILPPPFLCCGFPFGVNGRQEELSKIVLRNMIIFSQIKDMFKYIKFDAVCVTCGTCRESLERTGTADIFETKITDVLNVIPLNLKTEDKVLYHKPCHDSLDSRGVEIIGEKLGCHAHYVPHCCSEAGTLALCRPNIASNMRKKKTGALQKALKEQNSDGLTLTNCPSCIQGLGKQKKEGIRTEHTSVYAARKLGGEDWKKELS
ncbi:MAG TPA: DUF3683 domain-containing protein, partial [Leptospiraceae bacterium]|nr:DUF3683 domain-containing protein [Leptospiraceae bacterium]